MRTGFVRTTCSTEAMNLHLTEIAEIVAPSTHAVLLVDQAGWHLSTRVTSKLHRGFEVPRIFRNGEIHWLRFSWFHESNTSAFEVIYISGTPGRGRHGGGGLSNHPRGAKGGSRALDLNFGFVIEDSLLKRKCALIARIILNGSRQPAVEGFFIAETCPCFHIASTGNTRGSSAAINSGKHQFSQRDTWRASRNKTTNSYVIEITL